MPKRIGLLDTVTILLLATVLVLFVLWLGGRIRGFPLMENLPEFVVKAYSSVWSYLTGAAGSTLLVLLRRRGKDGPNYLLCSFGAALALLLLVFCVSWITPPPKQPSLPDRALLLKFSLQCEGCNEKDGNYPKLSFLQKHPIPRHYHTIAPEKDFHYEEYVDVPDEGGGFLAHAVRGPVTDSDSRDPNSPVTQLCFMRKPKEPSSKALFEVWMACPEGKRCSISPEDPGWASRCADGDSDWSRLLEFVPRLDAEQNPAQGKTEPGWKVPSLETLQKMADQKRAGYTEFSIQSNQLKGLEHADAFGYLIRANGSPLYVDGWPPEDMIEPFTPAEGLKFSFGLQNLSFSGADKGCEKIEVSIEFRQRERILKQVVLSRRYAALRDAGPEVVKSQDGASFTWKGRYVKPSNEDRYEVFVDSTTNAEGAMSTKSLLDAAALTYNGMGVVGVLRPPLDKAYYGVVVGLRQPTGQIRFTFDQASAQQLLGWVLQTSSQHAKLKSFLRPDSHLYEMKPGDSGVGKLNSCSGAAQQT